MGKRLFVGNLSYEATEAQVREPFAAVGKVASVRMIIDRETGKFKGFAFVEMSSDAEATAAITQCNNKEIAGRRCIVSEARPMGEKPAPRPGGPGGGFRPAGGGPGGGFRPSGGPPSGPPGGFGAPQRDFNRGPKRGKAEWEKKRDERERESREKKRVTEKERRNPKYEEVDADADDDVI